MFATAALVVALACPLDEPVDKYVGSDDPTYLKFKKKMDERLKQKVEDTGLTETAVITIYVRDWLSKNEKTLLAGPEKASQEFRNELALHVKLVIEKKAVWPDWTKYKKETDVWAKYFKENKR